MTLSMKNRRHNDDVYKLCYAQDLQIPFVKQNISKKSLQHQLSSISFFFLMPNLSTSKVSLQQEMPRFRELHVYGIEEATQF